MLLRGVPVPDDRLQAAAIDGAEDDGEAHAAHGPDPSGLPSWIQPSDLIHYLEKFVNELPHDKRESSGAHQDEAE